MIHVAPAEFWNTSFRIGETAVSVEQRRESYRSRAASGSGRRKRRCIRESRSDPFVARTAFGGIRRVEQAAVIGESFRSDRFGRRFVLRRRLPFGNGRFARRFGNGRLPRIGGSRMRIGIRSQYGRAFAGLRGDYFDFGSRLQQFGQHRVVTLCRCGKLRLVPGVRRVRLFRDILPGREPRPVDSDACGDQQQGGGRPVSETSSQAAFRTDFQFRMGVRMELHSPLHLLPRRYGLYRRIILQFLF